MVIHALTTRPRTAWRVAVVAAALAICAPRLSAQGQPAAGPDLSQIVSSATVGEPFVLKYNNRPITVLRATILSRSAADRAAAAVGNIERAVREGVRGPVTTRTLQDVTIVSIGSRDIFAILPQDLDQLTGETRESKAAEAVPRLEQAITEAIELRTPRLLLKGAALALLATVLFGLLFVLAWRTYRTLAVRLPSGAERKLHQLAAGNVALIKASHASDLLRFAVRIAFVIVSLTLTYMWLTFTLRRFPYTRPWGESLRAFLIERLTSMGLLIASAIPNLFTVLLIVLLTRFAVKLAHAFFDSVREGRLDLPYVHPETALPTRRIVTTLFCLLGLVVAYPYLPGSGSDAFKGLSVFVGLVLSLGSSGVVNQLMSGLTLTYSRAMRPGDFVRIGEIEGTITQLGGLSTKIKTPRGEEVTIPNAVVMGQVTTNFSRFAETDGVYTATSLTIGYDTPWRQVHALLLLAAERTPGIRSQPKPAVRQTALQDFYVQYTLLVSLEQPHLRAPTLDALHGNIQDAFNEYGVQIMSPNYEADPEGPKVVPPEQWYAAPAKPAVAERV